MSIQRDQNRWRYIQGSGPGSRHKDQDRLVDRGIRIREGEGSGPDIQRDQGQVIDRDQVRVLDRGIRTE